MTIIRQNSIIADVGQDGLGRFEDVGNAFYPSKPHLFGKATFSAG